MINKAKTTVEEYNIFNASSNILKREIKISFFFEGRSSTNLKSYAYFARSGNKDVFDKDSGRIIVNAEGRNNIEIAINAGNSGKIFVNVFAIYNINGVDVVSVPYRKVFNRSLFRPALESQSCQSGNKRNSGA